MTQPKKWFAESEAGDQPETRLESVEEIRRAIVTSQHPAPAKAPGSEKNEAHPYRPVYRPPMALLCILDDGCDDGEWVRIREDKIVIGRSEGKIIIAHDAMISSKHAEVSRHVHKGGYRWVLSDLGSTNGTFVRISDTPIKHGQEILLGSRRFRFNAAPQGAVPLAEASSADYGKPQETRGWQAISPQDLIPSLVEITPQGDRQKFMLKNTDAWVGRDPKRCSVVITDDLMVSPCHCRLHRDPKGQWHLENAGSCNGTWVRINKVPLHGNVQFQLGEQRFFIKMLP